MRGALLSIWMPLSLILTGLGLASTIQNLWSVEVVSIPEMILAAYHKFRDTFFDLTLQWWLPFQLPIWFKDIISLYAFCSFTVYNYYKWAGNLEEWGRYKVLMLGPYLLALGIYCAFNKDIKRQEGQYVIFFYGHVAATLIFGSVTAIFFLWNHFAIMLL